MGSPPLPQPRLFKATGARFNPQVEWIEVQVKSVINHVKGMPFEWSINPYRGCEHACPFCVSPETPILMADGSHQPIHRIRPGDFIYGTEVSGVYRRYVKTQVLARWESEKLAYLIALEDGTQLLASGDHRFLTERGWKYVTGSEQGRSRRPFLTVNNKLMGVGSFSRTFPKSSDSDYRLGYLAGIIRGDGLLKAYKYDRPGRCHGNIDQFRLALTDIEALDRTASYLSEFDVPTFRFTFYEGNGRTRTATAIRTSVRAHVEAIEGLIAWPERPSREWDRGFLAGIFDAEGSAGPSVLRIANTDNCILEHTRRALTLFGFHYVTEIETHSDRKPVTKIRIPGGLGPRLRFLHTVDPAISRKRTIEGLAVKNPAKLRVVAIVPTGQKMPMIDISTETGDFIADGVISHNCYARRTHWFLDQDGIDGWSSRIFVKVNAPEVLRAELARPSWNREEVEVGTATDPYQPAEGAYKVTRRILEALRDYDTPVGLITRSTMVVRDLDVLRQLAAGPGATVCFSIATVDEKLARELEPAAPPPLRRLEAMRALSNAGVPTVLMLAPVMPGITDDVQNLTDVVQAAKEHGATSLHAIALHLGEVTRDAFFNYLRQARAELVPEYDRLYRRKYAPSEYQQQVQKVVAAIKARVGFTSRNRRSMPERECPVSKAPSQLQLFSR
jgi:DNA repair photolyase